VGYEAGYRSLISQTFSLDVAAFHNRYDHLLSLEPGTAFIETDPAPPHVIVPFTNGNGLKGTTSGFEIAPDWKPATAWRLRGSYSYLHMEIRPRPGSRDMTTAASLEGSSPRHQVKIQSFFDLTRNVELTLGWRYVSALPAQGVNGYQTGDIRAAWRPKARVELAVNAQNLVQPHHAEFGGDPIGLVGIKRNIFASVTFTAPHK
jgi:iron complex outermembrane receptor protein